MKKNSTLKFYLFIVSILVLSATGFSQCPGGYTQAQLNWDHIDFLPSNNARYSSFYPSAAFPYNQNFTIGTRTVNFTMAPAANITLNGENALSTGHAGSFSTAGDDVQFTTTSTANTTITLSTAVGDIWLGDIDACVTGAFPNNYQQISRPFTGQPQYVLAVVNNNIYYMNPANGKGYFLFNEPAHNRLNSMAYDPYKRVVYYTFSLTGGSIPQTD